MEEIKIFKDDGNGYYKGFIGNDVEFINPIEYYSNLIIHSKSSSFKEAIFLKMPLVASQLSQNDFLELGKIEWTEEYDKIMSTEVPINFLKLLESERKKEQVDLMKGQGINTRQLIALSFKAWSDQNYSFSLYKSEIHHKGLEVEKLPLLINTEGDEVKTVGKTELTDGELKNVIRHRNVRVAKFFDRNDEWHCFFLTYKGLGEERWKGGQAHLHYISDKWGISRDEAVRRFRSEKYPTTKVHIDLLGYGNQTNR